MFSRKHLPVLALALLVALLCGGTGIASGATPVVKAISPNNGSVTGGTQVAITGEGFIAGSTVKFGASSAASVTIESSSEIKATSRVGTGLAGISVTNSNGTSAATPYDQFSYDRAPTALWLGVDGNSTTYLGSVDYFAEREVVYDRSGPVDVVSGELPNGAIETDVEDGMIPVVTIEYKGYNGDFESDPEFPQKRSEKEEADGRGTIKEYVHGFIKTAEAVLEEEANTNPEVPLMLEPMNEPWGYTTPQFNGTEYAEVIAELLPEAQSAGIPLSDIYVAAIGKKWLPEMYAAQTKLETEVQGWYLHPYGPPSGTHEENSEGIQSVPYVQAEMTSGQNNIIVSEVGYCAKDVNEGIGCNGTEESVTAAAHLTEMLDNAKPYHEQGWLRALLVYSRNAGGWAMQMEPGVGTLTKQGEALEAFAKSQVGWSTLETVQPKSTVRGVSCAESDDCLAVGWKAAAESTEAGFGARWNGSKWTVEAEITPPNIRSSQLNSVACASSTACTAVGDYITKLSNPTKLFAAQWNGTKWQQHLMPSLESEEPVPTVRGMSCSSSTACTVVGSRIPGKTLGPFVNRWNGVEWTSESTPKIEKYYGAFGGVSCPSSTKCMAVGGVEAKALIESWNAVEWKIKSTEISADVTRSNFTSVSCPSSAFCVAVGTYTIGLGPEVIFADRWNGSQWRPETLPNPLWATDLNLKGVSCTTATACIAVGGYTLHGSIEATLIEAWNGREWAVQASPNAKDDALSGVSCTSTLECVAVAESAYSEANY